MEKFRQELPRNPIAPGVEMCVSFQVIMSPSIPISRPISQSFKAIDIGDSKVFELGMDPLLGVEPSIMDPIGDPGDDLVPQLVLNLEFIWNDESKDRNVPSQVFDLLEQGSQPFIGFVANLAGIDGSLLL